MADPNVNRPEWDVDSSEPPFRRRAMRLGSRAGAAELGVTLYEIDPGGAVSPYHAHHANEELLLVLDGRPQLRTPTVAAACNPATRSLFHAARSARTGSATPTVRPHACSSSPR